MTSIRYYHADDQNQPVGPFTLSDLEKMIAAGMVDFETQVCEEGGPEWVALSTLLHAASESGNSGQRLPRTAPPTKSKAANDEAISRKKKARKDPLIDTSFENNVKRPFVKVLFVVVAIGMAFLGVEVLAAVFNFDPDSLRGNRKNGLLFGLTIVFYFILRVGTSFVDGFRQGSEE